jgi:hypothetical protein
MQTERGRLTGRTQCCGEHCVRDYRSRIRQLRDFCRFDTGHLSEFRGLEGRRKSSQKAPSTTKPRSPQNAGPLWKTGATKARATKPSGGRRRPEEIGGGEGRYGTKREMNAQDCTANGNRQARKPIKCSGGHSSKIHLRMSRIRQRESVIDKPGYGFGHGLRFPHRTARAGSRSVPRRLRFESEENCQQAEAEGDRSAPKGRGKGERP